MSLGKTREGGRSGRADLAVLVCEGTVSLIYMFLMDLTAGICAAAAAVLFTLWYRKLCLKQFGGVTGDTAGFYVAAGEGFLLTVAAVMSLLLSCLR